MPRSKNTGMPSEAVFDAHYTLKGAAVFAYSFTDTRKLRGAGGRGFTNSRPSDRIVTEDGVTFYAEIKSTTDERAFRFSLIKKFQWGCAERQVKAGGQYWFYVHCLPTNTWYRIPAHVVLCAEKRSLLFKDLKEFVWQPQLRAA